MSLHLATWFLLVAQNIMRVLGRQPVWSPTSLHSPRVLSWLLRSQWAGVREEKPNCHTRWVCRAGLEVMPTSRLSALGYTGPWKVMVWQSPSAIALNHERQPFLWLATCLCNLCMREGCYEVKGAQLHGMNIHVHLWDLHVYMCTHVDRWWVVGEEKGITVRFLRGIYI